MPEHPTDAQFSFTIVFKQALKVLKELLGKPTDSIRQFDKNNVFDPSKATAIKNTEERHKVFLRIATKALKR